MGELCKLPSGSVFDKLSEFIRNWKHTEEIDHFHHICKGLFASTRCYFNVRSKADMSQLNLAKFPLLQVSLSLDSPSCPQLNYTTNYSKNLQVRTALCFERA